MFRSNSIVKRFYSEGISHTLAKKSCTLNPWTVQSTYNSYDVTHADGCYLYKNNSRVMDFTSGLMVVNLGHNNQYIKEGFKQYLDTGIAYINSLFVTDQREKLSERLINITDNSGGKVFYANGGADSNETAVFLMHEYHKEFNNYHLKKILTFSKSFHGGSTIGATLLSGDPRRVAKESYYSLPFESLMQNPSMEDNGEASLAQIKELFSENNVGGIIIEGSSGSAGCIPYPPGYLQKLEKMCRERGILITCDEVMSGWGRTGSLFAYEKHGIQPDIITTAKGLTSGYIPFGAVILSKKIADIYHNKPLVHGLTYFAHPLSCTITNRCIDLYTEDNNSIVTMAIKKGNIMYDCGQSIAKDLKIVKEYRNNGLLGCFELDTVDEKILGAVSTELMLNGVYCFRRTNMLFTAPPLIITREEIETSMEIIRKVLHTASHNIFIYN